MRRAKRPLTGLELEIMKVVWRLGPATVRQVYEARLAHRRIAYTTLMTMMSILGRWGFPTKRQGDRAFVHAAAQPEKQVIRSMVREFVERVFNGAAEPLLVHLVEDEKLTAEDLKVIRRAIKGTKRS